MTVVTLLALPYILSSPSIPSCSLTSSAGSSSAYAQAQGASKATVDMFEQVQMASPGMNYGMVQSAATSSEFVSRCFVKHKKKFSSK